MFAGIDWASECHAVCVLDDAGTRITTFEITHTAEGLDVSIDIFEMMMAKENASQRREWMETYGNLVEADIT